MDEIVIDRGEAPTMNFDEDEQRLWDEIEISKKKKSKPLKRPGSRQAPTMDDMMMDDELDAFANPMKQQEEKPPEPMFGNQQVGYDDDEMPDYQSEAGSIMRQPQIEKPSTGYFSVDDEKADLLNKLTRLEKKGFTINKRLNAYSDVNEMRAEYKRIMYGIEVEGSIKFSRRMLVACTTGLEFLNRRYNPFELQLEGWSESIMEDIDSYDGVFEELYAKYRTKMQMAPEVKLIMMLGGSAMMFHLTNSMFKAAIPNVNDILKQNPGLAQSMMSAVKNTVPRGQAPQQQTPTAAPPSGEEYEMSGPGIDLSQLMGTISMPPPPPVSSTSISRPEPVPQDDDDISDIVSDHGEEETQEEEQVKEVAIPTSKPKRGRKSKKNELNL
jgi:hypothetical protein